MTRALWIGRELIGIPDGSKVVFPAGESIALVSVPRAPRIFVLTADGACIEAPEERADAILHEYFGEVTPTI